MEANTEERKAQGILSVGMSPSRYQKPYREKAQAHTMGELLAYLDGVITDRDNAVRAVRELEHELHMRNETVVEVCEKIETARETICLLEKDRDNWKAEAKSFLETIHAQVKVIQRARERIARMPKRKR